MIVVAAWRALFFMYFNRSVTMFQQYHSEKHKWYSIPTKAII